MTLLAFGHIDFQDTILITVRSQAKHTVPARDIIEATGVTSRCRNTDPRIPTFPIVSLPTSPLQSGGPRYPRRQMW